MTFSTTAGLKDNLALIVIKNEPPYSIRNDWVGMYFLIDDMIDFFEMLLNLAP